MSAQAPLAAQSLGTGGNELLAKMPRSELQKLAVNARRVRFDRGEVLVTANCRASAALFVEEGIASVVKPNGAGRATEIALVGRDSFVGSALVMADGRSPYETFVQVDSLTAIRIDAADLAALVERSPACLKLLLAAIHVRTVQIAEGLVSAAWQRIVARLSRWLLMYRDRMGVDSLDVTHEFMALMVCAQRTKITDTLHHLEGVGAIVSTRGRVVIRDVAMLRTLADGCYGVPEREADRLLVAEPGAGDTAPAGFLIGS